MLAFRKMNFSLEDKMALITGGSRGIGRATAIGFAEAGVKVVVTSRKLPDLEKLAAHIRDSGKEFFAVSAHIGRIEEIVRLLKTVTEKLCRIDILVNNAGGSPTVTPALNVDESL